MPKFFVRRVIYMSCEIEAESEEDALENVVPNLAEEDYDWNDSEETVELMDEDE